MSYVRLGNMDTGADTPVIDSLGCALPLVGQDANTRFYVNLNLSIPRSWLWLRAGIEYQPISVVNSSSDPSNFQFP